MSDKIKVDYEVVAGLKIYGMSDVINFHHPPIMGVMSNMKKLIILLCVCFNVSVEGLLAESDIQPLAIIPEHTSISSYEGPRTCIQCHETESLNMFSSVHYQWSGMTPYVTNIAGNAGKGDIGFNTYCGAVITSRRVACWSCHAGNGKTPSSSLEFKQIQNIDCLMCHSQMYKRKAVPPFLDADFNLDRHVDIIDLRIFTEQWLATGCDCIIGCNLTDLFPSGSINFLDYALFTRDWQKCTDSAAPCNFGWTETVTAVDFQGVSHTWTLPKEAPNGDFQYGPDQENMSIDIVQAAQTVHMPNRATCLRCHAYAAGTDCGKRGDLGTATIAPPVDVDVHMSPEGLNFSCQRCHVSIEHKMIGRGLDLRPTERAGIMTCGTGGCHTISPHSDTDLNNHAIKIACQSCHIPFFAKLTSTEVERDWRHPSWAQGLFGGQGGYKPEEIRAMNLVPTYKWYNSTSRVYALGEVATQNANGEYEFGVPNGSVNDTDAQIYPMKEHISNSARHDGSGIIIPHSTSEYFFTGDFNRAVQTGMEYMGLTGTWTLVPIHTYQTINHTVEPTSNALTCGHCHQAYSTGQLRMDLQGELGYQLKNSLNEVCTQCHNFKNPKGFEDDHRKHVTDKHFDCSWCHLFSRPGRNLTMP